MTETGIQAAVCKVLVEEFELDEGNVKMEARLLEDLGLDSLDSVDLVVALERVFNFKIGRTADSERISQIRTVSDICDFVAEKQGRV